MNHSDIESQILHDLYEIRFLSKEDKGLNTICDEGDWENTIFWNTVDRMTHQGLVRPFTMDGFYQITSLGIIEAEERGLVPEEVASENSRIRTTVLDVLANLYETRGSFAGLYIDQLVAETESDKMVLVHNLQVLEDLEYIEDIGTGCKITHRGIDAVEEWRQRGSIVEEFERISKMRPQQRGRAFQKLFAKVVEQNDWAQEEGVRTSHEEMDVIIYQEREYYLVECKWEKDPIQAHVIRELYGKLSNRVGTRGLVVSMSGFTSGALTQTAKYVSDRVILLFGPNDVNSMIHERVAFDNLLDTKYKALITQGEIIFS